MKLKSINPHDQSIVGEIKIATKRDVEKAVTRAKKTKVSNPFGRATKLIKHIY